MHAIKPTVSFVTCTMDPIQTLYMAARRCYSADSTEFVRNMLDDIHSSKVERKDMIKLIRECIKSGHLSVLEHVSFTFHIVCSRSCSHQLVRHRLASYSQQSQRYVKYSDIEYINKPSLPTNVQDKIAKDAEDMYTHLLSQGYNAEEARVCLPNSTATSLIVTMNLREIMHFIEERTCSRAEYEIRSIANQILALFDIYLPELREDMGPKCKARGYCTEAKSCGLYPRRKYE